MSPHEKKTEDSAPVNLVEKIIAAPAHDPKDIRKIDDALKRVFNITRTDPQETQWSIVEVRRRWRDFLQRLMPLGDVSVGNDITFYHDGDSCYNDMFKAIDGAKKRVWLETYIMQSDETGQQFLKKLTAAAERGVDVILLTDSWGSINLDDNLVQPLRAAGGVFVKFNPLIPWLSSGPLLWRDHRKILVADEEGFCGSMNIGDEYRNSPHLHRHQLFKDSHLKIRGPAVSHLAATFLDSMSETSTVTREVPGMQAPAASGKTGAYVQVLRSNVRRDVRSIQQALSIILNEASYERVHITSPYFLPPKWLLKSIIDAQRRGVDVRIVTAGISDVPLICRASEHIYGQFLKNGVKIYEIRDSTLHAKTLVVDGVYSCVGSFNLDRWSGRRNLEVTISMLDRKISEQIDSQFEKDMKNAREITLENWKQRDLLSRLLGWASYHLVRLSGKQFLDGLVDPPVTPAFGPTHKPPAHDAFPEYHICQYFMWGDLGLL